MDEAAFAQRVSAVLAHDALDEVLLYGQYVRLGPALPFEDFARAAYARCSPPLAQPEPLTPESCDARHAATTSLAERFAADPLYLQLQSWRHERITAAEWRACLAAFGSPAGWLTLARAHEDAGRTVLANASLAAARWLDPEGARNDVNALVSRRRERLPPRLVAQPDPGFRALPFARRHHAAWAMKNAALLELPSLLAFESDENFSIRARVYRSLGQHPHPASIECLREATRDPHPFARAQAARSLGWCVDPGSLALLAELARTDPAPDVRRAAKKARERVVAWWTHCGHWARLVSDPAEALEAARSFVAQGLLDAAYEVLRRVRGSHRELDALAEQLDNDADEVPEQRYGDWFADALRDESALREPPDDDATLARALAGADEAACERALYAVSWHGRAALRPEVEALRGRPGAVGWGARRAMRCLGWSARG